MSDPAVPAEPAPEIAPPEPGPAPEIDPAGAPPEMPDPDPGPAPDPTGRPSD